MQSPLFITVRVFSTPRQLTLGSVQSRNTKLDPDTLAVSLVGQVHGFGIDGGSLSAIDAATQTLFWIGMKQPYVPGKKNLYIVLVLQ